MASTKVEAKRFNGKPGTYAAWQAHVEAYFDTQDWSEHLNDGSGVPANKKDEWRKAQRQMYSYLVLVCDGRASAAIRHFKNDEAKGWKAFKELEDKYGGAKARQLSASIKDFFNYKQGDVGTADYLIDMKTKHAHIMEIAGGDADKIWSAMANICLVENLKGGSDGTP